MSLEKEGNRLIVQRVPKEVDAQAVHEHFAHFGTVIDVHLPNAYGTYEHKGLAFITYEDRQSVELAVSYQPHELAGQEIIVGIAEPKTGKGDKGLGKGRAVGNGSLSPSGVQSSRLFVTNVPQTIRCRHLEEHFARFGKTADIYLPLSHRGGGDFHKGFAFVTYESPSSASQALAQSGGHFLHDQQVTIEIAEPKKGKGKGNDAGANSMEYAGGIAQQGQTWSWGSSVSDGLAAGGLASFGASSFGAAAATSGSNRIIVKGVPLTAGQREVGEYFGQFGEFSDVFLPPLAPGSDQHKGCSFVTFADPSTVAFVMTYTEHYLLGVKVDVEVADPKPGKGGKGGMKGGAAPPVRAPPAPGSLAAALRAAEEREAAGGPPAYGDYAEWNQPRGASYGQLPDNNRICVHRLTRDMTKAQLMQYFEQFGEVMDLYLPLQLGSATEHKGVCFVTFTNFASAEAVLGFPAHIVGGAELTVEKAEPKPSKGSKGGLDLAKGKGKQGKERLFIANLPQHLTMLDLQVHFESHGDVLDVYVPPDVGSQGHKGIAFITFAETEELTQALEVPHVIRGCPLRCELAMPKESKGTGKGGFSPY